MPAKQAPPKVILRMSSIGKDVRPLQPDQAPRKFVPAAVLMAGKDVRPLQLFHVLLKSVPAAVLIFGKDVKAEHEVHAYA